MNDDKGEDGWGFLMVVCGNIRLVFVRIGKMQSGGMDAAIAVRRALMGLISFAGHRKRAVVSVEVNRHIFACLIISGPTACIASFGGWFHRNRWHRLLGSAYEPWQENYEMVPCKIWGWGNGHG